MGSELRVTGLSHSYGKKTVLSKVDLIIPAGTYCTIVGPSGCGKTTLLRLVAGLEAQQVGRIAIDGHDAASMSPSERGIAMVFQKTLLYPHLTVRDNLSFPLRVRRSGKTEREATVEAAADRFSLHPLLERYPAKLSGGEAQRVALAKALIQRPNLLLLDEPLANLDAHLKTMFRNELHTLHQKDSVTVLHVTHDHAEAMSLSDLVVVLAESAIVQIGPPDGIYRRPATRFVAQFFGDPPMNILDPAISGDTLGAFTDSVTAVGDDIVVGVRPHDVRIGVSAATGVTLRVRYLYSEHRGSTSFAVCQHETGLIWVEHPPEVAIPSDAADGIAVSFPRAALHFFDRATGMRVLGHE